MPARGSGKLGLTRRDDPNAYSRAWRAANREKYNTYMREYHAERKVDPNYKRRKNTAGTWTRRKTKYGVTHDFYNQMLANQAGICLICRVWYGEALRVDHDHKTKEVRGLLCTNCNSGLGLFQEDTTRLRNAVVYLQQREKLDGVGLGLTAVPFDGNIVD
jgi:hypothetical protein